MARCSIDLVDQELTRRCNHRGIGIGRRMERGQRILAIRHRRLQARHIQTRPREVAAQVVALGIAHGRIELDENVAGLDALAILDMDGADDAGGERLHHLDAAAGHDLAGRRGDDIDLADTRPRHREREHADDGERQRPADRRGRRLDDLQRSGQKGELIPATKIARARQRERQSISPLHRSRLQAMQRRVTAAGDDELVVRAVLDEAAALERQRCRSARRTVERRCAMMMTVRPLRDPLHVLLDDALALVVERARRLVEDQDARIGDEGAGDGDALALAARQRAAALADDGVVAFRQLEDEVVRAGELGGGDDALHRRRRIGERDVVADGAVEQHVLLQHDADLAPQPGDVDHGEIDAVDQHAPALGHVEPLHELGERALARARGADDADAPGLPARGSSRRAGSPARRCGSGRSHARR